MTHIIFYEKPGCGGNAKQRALLEAAGHTLERRSLLDAAWTAQSLLAFLQPLPVHQWFNRAAPRIKHGEVVPESLHAEAALALLLAEPLLIRRPLMQRPDGARLVGFDTAEVERFVGLEATTAQSLPASMEGCAAAGHAKRSVTCKTAAGH
jgi:nitrogenase-associated protein